MAHLEYITDGQPRTVPLNAKAATYLLAEGQLFKLSPEPARDALAAFYHSRRHFVLLGWRSAPILVNQCKITLLKIVREADQLAIGPHAFVFHELATEILRADSELVVSGRRCLVDRRPFKPNDKVIYCPACGTPHHEHCWQFQKARCANGLACDYQGPWDEPEAEPK